MFTKVLIANRGAIACRVTRTLKRMGVASVAVYSEADAESLHVTMADEAVCIGPAAVGASYLAIDRILDAASKTGAQAVHPGYGFLSENAQFALRCEAAGIAFLGPTAEQMRRFGLKHTARALARSTGVPLLPGSELLVDVDDALTRAADIGFPVMLKSSAGGGGIGMQMCASADELRAAFDSVKRLAVANFSDGGVFIERYIGDARHIEVQVFGDGRGRVIALGERDCSLQRRNQKVVEETPAPNLRPEVRAALLSTATTLAAAASYRSAGTVEFVVDAKTQEFFFLEVNARLQVEHGVTEAVTGIDIVEWMVRLAADELPALETLTIEPRGHAIQARLYAEDPAKGFQPSTGVLTELRFPAGLRVDTWVERGTEVTSHYDPMLAKLIAHGRDRDEALARLGRGLAETRVAGLESNLDYLRGVMSFAPFVEGRHTTKSLHSFTATSHAIDVLAAGVQTSVQDWPGRRWYWNVGVPPSGPMDSLALRLANRLVGNAAGDAALEITVAGPTLRLRGDVCIAVTGAPIELSVDGQPVAMNAALELRAGQTVRIGRVTGAGARAYLAIDGGIDVPLYLGSRSTFTLGQFGGHGGRLLRAGDVLHVGRASPLDRMSIDDAATLVPHLSPHWDIGVLIGPHAAPDFFTFDDIETFFATDWQVHYNSSRTGVRLIGPKPAWARRDGGEAGLHPSNIHDNAYAIGAIDFTGDMPVILGPDGPSLGGFVCPATVAQSELWKLGQLSPGDTIRFRRMTMEEATAARALQDAGVGGPARADGSTAQELPSISRDGRQYPSGSGSAREIEQQSQSESESGDAAPHQDPFALRYRSARASGRRASIPQPERRESGLPGIANARHTPFALRYRSARASGRRASIPQPERGESGLPGIANARHIPFALRYRSARAFRRGASIPQPERRKSGLPGIANARHIPFALRYRSAVADVAQGLPSIPRDGRQYLGPNGNGGAPPSSRPADAAVLHRTPATTAQVEVVYRRAGDAYVLIEFGEPKLDLELRFLVHALMTRLEGDRLDGIVDLTPGIRSLQVHYDAIRLPLPRLLDHLLAAQAELGAIDDIEVPSRTVWLPLSWDDPATRLAIEKYAQSVRADAPWCPSNIEFIRRINGLADLQAVHDIVFEASYMVLGLGDVYLGAPVATPLDPRHRLVTTKYNPARTWTPENAVGIGGAYLCVYGMEGPGGYQFVGRTVQMWNRWRVTDQFVDGKPWLLRFFDRIRFYPVGHEALLDYRKDFVAGRVSLRIEDGRFRLSDYRRFLETNAESIAIFKQGQQAAFEAERERWRVAGISETPAIAADFAEDASAAVEAHRGEVVASQVSGGVWSVLVQAGDAVTAGQPLVVVESMKMEITVHATCDGRIERVLCSEGQSVNAGQPLLLMH